MDLRKTCAKSPFCIVHFRFLFFFVSWVANLFKSTNGVRSVGVSQGKWYVKKKKSWRKENLNVPRQLSKTSEQTSNPRLEPPVKYIQ